MLCNSIQTLKRSRQRREFEPRKRRQSRFVARSSLGSSKFMSRNWFPPCCTVHDFSSFTDDQELRFPYCSRSLHQLPQNHLPGFIRKENQLGIVNFPTVSVSECRLICALAECSTFCCTHWGVLSVHFHPHYFPFVLPSSSDIFARFVESLFLFWQICYSSAYEGCTLPPNTVQVVDSDDRISIYIQLSLLFSCLSHWCLGIPNITRKI